MRNLKVYFRWILLAAVVVWIIGISWNGLQAQVQSQGKPPKPPKPGKPPACTTDGICDSTEFDIEKGLNEQPCPDCQPLPSSVLFIDQVSTQLISNGSPGYLSGKIMQYKSVNGGYNLEWLSQSFDETTVYTCIGDADNNGEKEILGLAQYYIQIPNPGKGRKFIQGYDYKFIMYEDGCPDGNPYWVSPSLGESCLNMSGIQVADVDSDGLNEIIVRSLYQIHIYEWNGQDFLWTSSSPVHEQRFFSVSVGDADNDGLNEIIVPQFDTGLVYVYDYDDGAWNFKITPPITATNPYGSPVKINYARVGDADNDGKNEIVAGGNNYRLMIWKIDADGVEYNIEFVSDLLGGDTSGVDVGDLDNDGTNEVIVGASQSQTIFVFQFDGLTYKIVNSLVYDEGINDLIVGDLDSDGRDEIVTTSNGIHIFDLMGENIYSGYLERTYFHPYGGHSIEIR